MKPEELDRILSVVAHENQMTVAEVRNETMIALEVARKNPDPKVQAMWASIPRAGSIPTLEEIMDFLIGKLKEV